MIGQLTLEIYFLKIWMDGKDFAVLIPHRSLWFRWAAPEPHDLNMDFCWFVFSVILSCLFLAALWSPTWKGLTSWLSCVWCFLMFLSLSHMVSWVRCGIWLYRFLIFTSFPGTKLAQNFREKWLLPAGKLGRSDSQIGRSYSAKLRHCLSI